MFTITNIKITSAAFYGLFLLAILVFGAVLVPTEASAREYGGYIDSGQVSNPTVYYQEPVYVEPKVVYVEPKVVQTQPRVVYVEREATPSPVYSTTTTETTTIEEDKAEVVSDLAANAVYGSNTFLPSGLIQWVLFAIIILIIIILVRKISGADKRYHEAPLKHA